MLYIALKIWEKNVYTSFMTLWHILKTHIRLVNERSPIVKFYYKMRKEKAKKRTKNGQLNHLYKSFIIK